MPDAYAPVREGGVLPPPGSGSPRHRRPDIPHQCPRTASRNGPALGDDGRGGGAPPTRDEPNLGLQSGRSPAHVSACVSLMSIPRCDGDRPPERRLFPFASLPIRFPIQDVGAQYTTLLGAIEL